MVPVVSLTPKSSLLATSPPWGSQRASPWAWGRGSSRPLCVPPAFLSFPRYGAVVTADWQSALGRSCHPWESNHTAFWAPPQKHFNNTVTVQTGGLERRPGQPSWRRRRPKPRTSYVGTALNKETGIDRENSLSNGVLAAAQEGQGGALPGLRRSVHGHITT
jgi:hypothetical protein